MTLSTKLQYCHYHLNVDDLQKYILSIIGGLCIVFEIIDGATLDDGKLKALESGSHEYVVVTCAVSFELKSGDEILSLHSTCVVHFSGAVGKVLSL